MQEKFEDTKEVIRSRMLKKDTSCNGQTKEINRTIIYKNYTDN